MERLFVYGTLAPGRQNHDVLRDIPGEWESAIVRGKLMDEGWGAELGCPGIIPTDDGEEVQGFILASDHLSNHWSMLDEYEGAGYRRVAVLATTNSGEYVEAYVYALNREF